MLQITFACSIHRNKSCISRARLMWSLSIEPSEIAFPHKTTNKPIRLFGSTTTKNHVITISGLRCNRGCQKLSNKKKTNSKSSVITRKKYQIGPKTCVTRPAVTVNSSLFFSSLSLCLSHWNTIIGKLVIRSASVSLPRMSNTSQL